eukprot:4411135-Amphidinium_carterae.1
MRNRTKYDKHHLDASPVKTWVTLRHNQEEPDITGTTRQERTRQQLQRPTPTRKPQMPNINGKGRKTAL